MRASCAWAVLFVLSGCAETDLRQSLETPLTARAGADREVRVGDTVILDGQGQGGNGGIWAFRWMLTQRPDGSTAAPTRPNASSTRVYIDRAGRYELQLVVDDGKQTSLPDIVVLTAVNGQPTDAGALNRQPMASAGPDQSVTAGDLVMLNGLGSQDPDGDPLSFTWSLSETPPGSQAALEAPTTATPQLTTDLAGIYEVELIVSDGILRSAPDRVQIVASEDVANADTFDPDEVYIFGTTRPGGCSPIVTHWSTPQRGAVGFDCHVSANDVILAPDSNRLLYVNSSRLHEFRCDGPCILSGNGPHEYPRGPMANDSVLPTPSPFCDEEWAWTLAFKVWPDGEIIHRCSSPMGVWSNNQGNEVPGLTGEIVALGHNRIALVNVQGVLELVSTVTASVVPVTGFDIRATIIASRSREPAGLWVAIRDGDRPQLWSIEETGVASHVFTYAASPPGHVSRERGLLDGRQNLFHLGLGRQRGKDLILRRERDGPTTVVYNEADRPFVQIHGLGIVTGP